MYMPAESDWHEGLKKMREGQNGDVQGWRQWVVEGEGENMSGMGARHGLDFFGFFLGSHPDSTKDTLSLLP